MYQRPQFPHMGVLAKCGALPCTEPMARSTLVWAELTTWINGCAAGATIRDIDAAVCFDITLRSSLS